MKAAYAILAVLSVVSPALAQQAQPQPREGRYQIVFSPRVERDTFLLDTATGKVWLLTQFSFLNGEPSAWDAMPRLDTDQEETNFIRKTGEKERVPAPSIPGQTPARP